MAAEQTIPELSPQACFDELAGTFCEMHSDIRLGRKFGRTCIKFGKRPFIVLDRDRLAFRVGSLALVLVERYGTLQAWNPRMEKRPKESWLAYTEGSQEDIAFFAAIAFQHIATKTRCGEEARSEQAPGASSRCDPDLAPEDFGRDCG